MIMEEEKVLSTSSSKPQDFPNNNSSSKSCLNYKKVKDFSTTLEKRRQKTKAMLRNAFEHVEHQSRRTKERFTTEFRNALEEMEKKKQKTKEMLSKATTEILYAMEENDQKCQKRRNLTGGRIVPIDAVPHFKEPYVYNATCGSVLEMLFFQKFWIWLSQKVPRWIMPCTLTFNGLAINIICCAILIHYSPDGKSEVPSWVFYLGALNIFLYQTLDALDGKQCSKLQETHLEEIADHGSDSLSSTFMILSLSIALQLGASPILMILFQIVNLLAFYSTHWQTHVTDIVVFGRLDVTEAQCVMILIHLISAVFGQEVWHLQVHFLGTDLRSLFVLGSVVAAVITMLGNLKIICGGHTPLDCVVNIPRRQGLQIWYPVVPIVIWTFLISIACYSSTHFEQSPCLFCVTFGFAFSKLLIKLQISNLGKVDCELLDIVLAVPILLIVNNNLHLVPEHTALMSAMVFIVMDFLRFVTYLCWDICDFQDVYVFTLKYPVGHPKNRAGSRGIYLNGLNNKQVIERITKCK